MIVDKSFVEEIEMDLTGTCNLECPLCTRNYSHAQHLVKKNVRPLKDIVAQLDEYPNLQRFFVAGAVSEPTMYKEFLGFIEYLNSRNIRYELFTNGNTHNPAWWKHLGELVPANCMIAFTICGSTQELHEQYRVGSSLSQILTHARAVRESGRAHDWVQLIRFDYNADDINSDAMADIVKEFSNNMLVETEGIRRINNHQSPVPTDVRPTNTRDKTIRELFRLRPTPTDGKTYEMKCLSIMRRKVYINQFGQVSACYVHAEFEQDYFEGDTFDYSKILAFKYPDCFACEARTQRLIKQLGVDFVC
jgi:MoaA/NifB/PqqE/SkfB family radical SAM enzyme